MRRYRGPPGRFASNSVLRKLMPVAFRKPFADRIVIVSQDIEHPQLTQPLRQSSLRRAHQTRPL